MYQKTTGNPIDRNEESMQTAKVSTIALAMAGGLIGRALFKRWREFNFRDKVVLITGGSRGLGLVLAREFGNEGARLAICARDTDELERAREDLSSRGFPVLPIRCDISKQVDVEEMMARINDHYSQVDVLVNNAGVIEVGPLDVMTINDFRKAMDTHFWGPLYTTLAVLPQMRSRRSGRIVNITSIGGKVSVPHLLPYCSSKFALVGFSEGLRAELLKDGIRVTTVCPGLMRTGSARNADFKGKHRAEYALFSLSAALPISSMKAERAASQIVAACRRGEAEITLSIQAQVATIFHGLFPGLTADLLGTINQLLPGPGGVGTKKVKGKDSSSFISPSILTSLNDAAALQNNEVA
jgi:NAD(P)-dependent dehydrogenase (short-subunit alcohol dehydrogenase family)